MKKIKLGIDIDEVLRAKWLSFDRYYVDEFGEQGVKEPFDTYDFRNHYEFKDTEEVTQYVTDEFLEHEDMQKVSPKEYVVDPETGRASVDDFAFNTEKKFLTADEVFNRFLYEDYMFEIHGSASKLYMNADIDLRTFMKLFDEYFDFYFFVKTKKETIPATLFFLSKMRLEVKNIFFAYDYTEIWDKLDWVLTTNPDLLRDTPENKKTIKLTRMYNFDAPASYTSDGQIHELINKTIDEGETTSTSDKFKEFVINNI